LNLPAEASAQAEIGQKGTFLKISLDGMRLSTQLKFFN